MVVVALMHPGSATRSAGCRVTIDTHNGICDLTERIPLAYPRTEQSSSASRLPRPLRNIWQVTTGSKSVRTTATATTPAEPVSRTTSTTTSIDRIKKTSNNGTSK
ncbi:hypothetical protein GCM10022212_13440 [Actimicrobium antarcticum]|uniref:Secreted protein n=1 Tax=Actimicrobium antarcticum TaxID=1051899 RepID=A0ABP7SZC9_9BURK